MAHNQFAIANIDTILILKGKKYAQEKINVLCYLINIISQQKKNVYHIVQINMKGNSKNRAYMYTYS